MITSEEFKILLEEAKKDRKKLIEMICDKIGDDS